MPSMEHLEKAWDEVRETSIQEHVSSVARTRHGIGLLLQSWDFLAGYPFDLTTGDGASKVITWRFICSIPANALWCLDAACAGQVAAAGALMRILIEESFGMVYFAQHPSEALKHVLESPGRDELDFDQKLDRLGIPNKSLRRFYGELSNRYSHGNAVLRPELVADLDPEHSVISGEPKYIPIVTPFFAEYIDRCLAMALVTTLLHTFPQLHDLHPEWATGVTEFVAGTPMDDEEGDN